MSTDERSSGARVQACAAALAGQPSFWLLFIVTMFSWPILRSLRAERDGGHSSPFLGRVRPFVLRDAAGAELGSAQLEGRLWVASFTVVACGTPCRRTEPHMATLDDVRHRTRQLGDAFRLVTFPVDPERATAERMSELSTTYRASRGAWRFASGPARVVRDLLDDFQVGEVASHSGVALVDQRLRIRGRYDLADEAALGLLLRDISHLLSPDGS